MTMLVWERSMNWLDDRGVWGRSMSWWDDRESVGGRSTKNLLNRLNHCCEAGTTNFVNRI